MEEGDLCLLDFAEGRFASVPFFAIPLLLPLLMPMPPLFLPLCLLPLPIAGKRLLEGDGIFREVDCLLLEPLGGTETLSRLLSGFALPLRLSIMSVSHYK